MPEAIPDSDAPADAPVLDPNDPRSHPHHFIVRKKDSRKTRARAYHITGECPTIGKIADDSVLEDLSVEVVEYLGLGPCSTCTAPPKPKDQPDAGVEMVADAIKRIRSAEVPARPNSHDIAVLVVAHLLHEGFRISKARKGTLPDRADTDPISAWIEENTPFGDDEPDFEEFDADAEALLAAGVPDAAATGPAPTEATPPVDKPERSEVPTGRNPEVIVHDPGPPPAL